MMEFIVIVKSFLFLCPDYYNTNTIPGVLAILTLPSGIEEERNKKK